MRRVYIEAWVLEDDEDKAREVIMDAMESQGITIKYATILGVGSPEDFDAHEATRRMVDPNA